MTRRTNPSDGRPEPAGEAKERVGTLTERARSALAGRRGAIFEHFTKRARSAMTLAQEEARGLGHDYVGTEHLLLGLIREGGGVAAQALAALGIDLSTMREAVERTIGRGERAPAGELRLTPRLKRVLEFAAEDARSLKHRAVGTEHLLLGLVREGDSIAARVLEAAGLSAARVRAEVAAVLARHERDDQAAEPALRGNVVMCRVDDRSLDAIDALVEGGVRATRSDAAAWLIRAGIDANAPLLARLSETVAEIRRLRGVAQALAMEASATDGPLAPPSA